MGCYAIATDRKKQKIYLTLDKKLETEATNIEDVLRIWKDNDVEIEISDKAINSEFKIMHNYKDALLLKGIPEIKDHENEVVKYALCPKKSRRIYIAKLETGKISEYVSDRWD